MIAGTPPALPEPDHECPCCEGVGEHEIRPHITASPDDYLIRCAFCQGNGYVFRARLRSYKGRCTP